MRFSGIEVKAVATAAQALESIQTSCFDLYLLDACLPDIDGFELCRRLRERDSQTPILFFSGATCEADRERGIDAGANAYLVKPEIGELAETITRFVGHAGTATARVIPFARKMSFSPSFTYEPDAA